MTTTLKVGEGGRIELTIPNAKAGDTVEVTVTPVPERNLTLDEILAQYPGQRIFKTAEEVDTYIRELRDEWD